MLYNNNNKDITGDTFTNTNSSFENTIIGNWTKFQHGRVFTYMFQTRHRSTYGQNYVLKDLH